MVFYLEGQLSDVEAFIAFLVNDAAPGPVLLKNPSGKNYFNCIPSKETISEKIELYNLYMNTHIIDSCCLNI
jgi:hypothetical protein